MKKRPHRAGFFFGGVFVLVKTVAMTDSGSYELDFEIFKDEEKEEYIVIWENRVLARGTDKFETIKNAAQNWLNYVQYSMN